MYLDVLFKVDATPETIEAFWPAWGKELSGVILPVLLTWLILNTPWVLGLRLTTDPAKESPGEIKIQTSPSILKNTLNDNNWQNILYLKSELQYLDVVTQDGHELVLHSLRDAVSGIPDEMGIQPHRSYWVAKDAIKSFIPDGRQGKLMLTDGSIIPVSRSNVKKVEDFCHKIKTGNS